VLLVSGSSSRRPGGHTSKMGLLPSKAGSIVAAADVVCFAWRTRRPRVESALMQLVRSGRLTAERLVTGNSGMMRSMNRRATLRLSDCLCVEDSTHSARKTFAR
jgi:hypothetical protein